MKKRPSSMCALLAVRVAQRLDEWRLTGCLPYPVARHVGGRRAADNPKFSRNVRLTSDRWLPKDYRRSHRLMCPAASRGLQTRRGSGAPTSNDSSRFVMQIKLLIYDSVFPRFSVNRNKSC